ncbi:hypothetical protein ACQPYA_06975 [Micromonospora sp. CA-263727]|uniref:hypothetical protein n=1 Tax=Micromonospora sp. CA-263727 TaxID=3239967 RepID=UPI003D8B7E20
MFNSCREQSPGGRVPPAQPRLFWVYDRSPGQTRTRRLIDGAVPLIDRLVALSRLRVLRPVTRQVLDLIRTLRH